MGVLKSCDIEMTLTLLSILKYGQAMSRTGEIADLTCRLACENGKVSKVNPNACSGLGGFSDGRSSGPKNILISFTGRSNEESLLLVLLKTHDPNSALVE